jgi:iron complex transport system substrate-binding protein
MLLFTACQSENPYSQNNSTTRELTDDLGRTVKIPARVERAVSLAPNLTESVFAVGAGDRLIGVTSFCNFPDEAQKIPKVGDTINPNMETIIALNPQIVLVSTASQIETFTKTLEQQNIAVFITNPNDLDGVLNNLEQFGAIFGTEARAKNLIADLRKRISAVESNVKNKPVKVFVQISKEPLFTVGKDSFLTEIIRRAGGESATENVPTAYPKLSKETASALNPSAIILSDSEDNREPNDIFANSDAVKNGKVFRVNADIISRPAPRIVDALEQIARDLN